MMQSQENMFDTEPPGDNEIEDDVIPVKTWKKDEIEEFQTQPGHEQIEEFSQTQAPKRAPVIDLTSQIPKRAPEVINLISQTPAPTKNLDLESDFIVDDNSFASESPEKKHGEEEKPTPMKKPAHNGYMLFAKDVRHSVQTSLNTKAMTKVAKEIGQRWKKLSTEEKQEYKDLCKKQKQEYKAESLPSSPQTQEPMSPPPPLHPDMPKKPLPSGYMIFAREFRKEFQEMYKGKAVGMVMKGIAEAWKAFTLEEKELYKVKCKKEKENYEQWFKDHPDVDKPGSRVSSQASGGSDPLQLQLPLSRVQKLVKRDENLKRMRKKGAMAIAKAMELFVVKHATAALQIAKSYGRTGISYNDVAESVYTYDEFDFLESVFDMPIRQPKSAKKQVKRKASKQATAPRKKKQKIQKETVNTVKMNRIDSYFKRKD